MLILTNFHRLERLHAAGDRITQRVIHNPKLLAEDALCTLLDRITQLMLKIALRNSGSPMSDQPLAPIPLDSNLDPEDEGDDWDWLDELSADWDEDKDVHR